MPNLFDSVYYYYCTPRSYELIPLESRNGFKNSSNFTIEFLEENAILLFQGAHFNEAAHREAALNTLLDLIFREKWRFFPCIVLLTSEWLPCFAYELIACAEESGFSPLKNGQGFYLSDAKLFASIIRNIQDDYLENSLALTTIFDTSPFVKPLVQSAYIINNNEQKPGFRQSKRLNYQELKANLTYTVTQHYAQTQAFTQQQTLQEDFTQQQLLSQTQAHQQPQKIASNLFPDTTNFGMFMDKLEATSRDKQTYFNHFFTRHNQKSHPWPRLAFDYSFRLKVTSTLFGLYLSKRIKNGLAYDSFSWMDTKLANHLVDNILEVIDGLEPSSMGFDEGFFSSLSLFAYERTLNSYSELPYSGTPTPFQSCFIGSNLTTNSIINSLNWLIVTDFSSPPKQTIDSLLTVFKHDFPLTLNDEAIFKQGLITLFQAYCPLADLAIFKEFLNTFAHLNSDHIKQFLYVIILGYRPNVEKFLALLNELDRRNLLELFRSIYFDYARTIGDVADLLQLKPSVSTEVNTLGAKPERIPLFLNLMKTIPLNSDPTQWPLFERFAYHFLLYARIQSINIDTIELKMLQIFWQSIHAKLYQYHNQDSTATEHSLQVLVDNVICSEKGLVLAPVCQAKTILNGLERLIDNSIQHNTLEEQLTEFKDVSLLQNDALYAILHDGYRVITGEMAIEIDKICVDSVHNYPLDNLFQGSYRFPIQLLQRSLDAHDIYEDYTNLYTAVFRYLGGQSLREPIDFYRKLYQFGNQETNPFYLYFKQMLFGYFVLTKTGVSFSRNVDKKALELDFITYLLQKKYHATLIINGPLQSEQKEPTEFMHEKIKNEYRPIILACLQDFTATLQTLPLTSNLNQQYTVWYFYAKYQKPPSMIEQGLAQLGLNLTPSFETIAPIAKKPFSMHTLSTFFLLHRKELMQLSYLFNTYPHILEGLMVAKIRETFAAKCAAINSSLDASYLKAKKQILFNWIMLSINQISLNDFINYLPDIETLVSDFSEWALDDDCELLSTPITLLLHQHNTINDIKIIVQLFALIAQQKQLESYQSYRMYELLITLIDFPDLIALPDYSQELLPNLSTSYMNYGKAQWLRPLLRIANTLSNGELSTPGQTFNTLLFHCPWQQDHSTFFLENDLSTQALHGLARILADKPVNLTILTIIWRENNQTDFSEIYDLLNGYTKEQALGLSQLAQTIYDANSRLSMLDLLTQCNAHPKPSLLLLARLNSLYTIDAERIREIVSHSNLKEALRQLELSLYAENIERFDYNEAEVAKKIAKIRKKSREDSTADEPLTNTEQTKMLQEFKTLMSYMMKHPVLKVNNKDFLTIFQLDETQCKLLYQLLCAKLQDANLSSLKKQAYHLTLIALCCEVHYRTTKKFPRDTQILCELHNLDYAIQEVKTGGGKSIISEIRAVMLCAKGWTVDIATENIQLADTALRKFKLFYDYLGVPAASEVILPTSLRSAYIEGGIHHSTPANLSFFHINMALKKKSLPKRIALLCDEIDAVLTTTIQYRLASVLDPIYADIRSWSFVLTELLAFVQEDEIFLHNLCDEADDVHNFKIYFSRKFPDKKLRHFAEQIPDETLNKLLNSARIPQALQDGVDYLSIIRQEAKHLKNYAAPILNVGTKRPEPLVAFDQGLQQLVHQERNAQRSKGAPEYSLEPITETIVTVSAKNFFDFYSSVIGWTGTPGSHNELHEFFEQNKLEAYYYPVFHADLSQNLGTQIVTDRLLQHHAVIERIQTERAAKPNQPIILVADSPKAVAELARALPSDFIWQTYTGHEESGILETDIIERAGQEAMITITTLSLTRGTDFESNYPQGICLLNTAADITESDATQLEGRVARNGKPGQFCHIIAAIDLESTTHDITCPLERFKAHQHIISLNRQNNRLKTRFLEVIRYHILINNLIAMREFSDSILTQQHGLLASTINEKLWLEALRDFDKNSELIYNGLLGTHYELNSNQKEDFIREMVTLHQTILNRLINQQDVERFQAIEPRIALAQLQTAPLDETIKLQNLQVISDVLSSGWRAAGHYNMVYFWTASDDLLSEFQAYFDGECSLRVATAQLVVKRELVSIDRVLIEINTMQTIIENFAWNEVAENLQKDLIDATDSKMIQTISRFISALFTTDTIEKCKEFSLNYLEETKTNIEQKRWDELALPNFNVEWINRWMGRVKTLSTTFAYLSFGAAFAAGPIPFIISRFVLPTVLSWLKNMVKRWFVDSESTMVQVLIGLDDIGSDLSKLIEVLYKKDQKTMTVDDLLQNILPLFKNKALQLIINKCFESSKQSESLFQLLPDLIDALEPYRQLPCSFLKKPEIAMSLFMKMLQSNLVKKLIDPEIYDTLLQRIEALPPNFAEIFTQCTLLECLGVIKALAHPRFNECLNQLPPESDFSELKQWLLNLNNCDELPTSIQTPMRELHDYQSNHERIAQESQLNYRRIKQRFTLRVEDLQAYAKSLEPKPASIEVIAADVSWMMILNLKLTQLIMAYAVVLAINYCFFSLSILLVTGGFFALCVVPLIYQGIVAMLTKPVEDEFPNGIIPPLMDETNIGLSAEGTAQESWFYTSSAQVWSLFASKKANFERDNNLNSMIIDIC